MILSMQRVSGPKYVPCIDFFGLGVYRSSGFKGCRGSGLRFFGF